MTILLPAVAAAFAAFYIWLTVRIANRRERWAKWTLALLVVALAYPMSYPPVLWLSAELKIPNWTFDMILGFYSPAFFIIDATPPEIGNCYFWYKMLFNSEMGGCGFSEQLEAPAPFEPFR